MELFNRIGEIIASSLQEVGIDAYLDQDSLASEEVNDKMVEDNDYDLFLGYTTTGVATYRTAFGTLYRVTSLAAALWPGEIPTRMKSGKCLYRTDGSKEQR